LTDGEDEDDLIKVIGHTYKWARSLRRLLPDVVRVWRDQDYRSGLTDLELGLVDRHPSGELSLLLAGSGTTELRDGGQSATARGEVCCSFPSSNCEVSPGVFSCAGFCA